MQSAPAVPDSAAPTPRDRSSAYWSCASARPRSVEPGPGAGAAADRLVVLPRCVAEQKIVHRRLRTGDRAQRAEHRVARGLRDLGVASHHRGAWLRREKRPGRNDQLQRLQAAIVQWNVVADQATEHVQNGRLRYRRRRVEVALVLFAGAGEIDHSGAVCAIDMDRDAQRLPLSIR